MRALSLSQLKQYYKRLAQRLSGLTRGIVPTEVLFVHIGIVLPLLNLPASARFAMSVLIIYAAVCLLTYWLIKLRLRDSGLLQHLWSDHVLDERRSRVSVGVIVSMLEHLHIVFVFGGVILFSANLLYSIEPEKTWIDALFMAFMAFNLKGFDDYQIPETNEARAICALLSIVSVLFIGFVAAAFLKPFVIVFKHK